MGAIDQMTKGAANQFGREFGRAAANSILKGANHYTVKSDARYQGRIKPSDSEIVKGIKEINKVKFVTTNKANVSRLIEITTIAEKALAFKGVETLMQLKDIITIINEYNDKYEHGQAMVDDDFKGESVDFLNEKRKEYNEAMDTFNSSCITFVDHNYEAWSAKRKDRKTAAILAIFLSFVGGHFAYLKNWGGFVASLVFCWTLIPTVVSLVNAIQYLVWSDAKFDAKFNPNYVFYAQFTTPNRVKEREAAEANS